MPILQDAMQNAQAGAPAPVAAAATAPQNMDQMAAAPGGAPAPGGELPPPDPAVNSPLMKAHMDELANMVKVMAPEMRDAYERVLTAGKKMMYAPETAEAVHGLILDDSIPMANKLGEGVANLMIMLDNQGNGTIPKDVLIPVGVTLIFEAVDYMYECGLEATAEELSDGLELMVYGIYEGYNIPREEVDMVVDKLAESLDLDEDTKKKLVGGVKAREEEDAEAAEEAAEPPGQDNPEEEAFEQGFSGEQQKRGV